MRYEQCLFAAALVVGALASTPSRAATTVTTIDVPGATNTGDQNLSFARSVCHRASGRVARLGFIRDLAKCQPDVLTAHGITFSLTEPEEICLRSMDDRRL